MKSTGMGSSRAGTGHPRWHKQARDPKEWDPGVQGLGIPDPGVKELKTFLFVALLPPHFSLG